VLRQAVAKVVKQAAKTAGVAADLATHAGRRTVVTTLLVDGDEALEDIARFAGRAKPSSTAGYVKRLGRRPEAVAKRAAAVLDGHDHADEEGSEVRNHRGGLGSNGGSYRSGPSYAPADPDGPVCGAGGVR
jgi:hypothetical protein